jgi:hypothetical protein
MIAGDHESGGALAPAFPMVGTFGALANGVKLEFIQERAGLAEAGVDGQLETEPFRQAWAGWGRCVGCVHVRFAQMAVSSGFILQIQYKPEPVDFEY